MPAEITQEQLKSFVIYYPEEGTFRKISDPLKYPHGSIQRFSYQIPRFRIHINKTCYSAHRMAWLYVYGYLPKFPHVIDHIDGNALNNKISNLRCVHCADNNKNKRISGRNTSGVMGVSWAAKNKKWRVMISVNGKTIHYGIFRDLEDAKRARKEANKIYGYHENHGANLSLLSPLLLEQKGKR